MRMSLKVFAVAASAAAMLTAGAGAASADVIVNPGPAGPCSDTPNAFVESGGRVGVDLTIKCFE